MPVRFSARGPGVIRLESLGHDRIPPRSMSALLLSNQRRPDLRHAPGDQKGHGAAQHDFHRTMEGDLRSTYSRLFHYPGSDDDGCGGGRKPPTRRQLHLISEDEDGDGKRQRQHPNGPATSKNVSPIVQPMTVLTIRDMKANTAVCICGSVATITEMTAQIASASPTLRSSSQTAVVPMQILTA